MKLRERFQANEETPAAAMAGAGRVSEPHGMPKLPPDRHNGWPVLDLGRQPDVRSQWD